MHEYSIIQALMEKVEAEAAARSATSVRALTVRIGALSGVEPELLATAFELFRETTICDGARLDIVTVPAAWKCPGCGKEIASGEILSCPTCGLPATLASGDEIFLDRIEMEVPGS